MGPTESNPQTGPQQAAPVPARGPTPATVGAPVRAAGAGQARPGLGRPSRRSPAATGDSPAITDVPLDPRRLRAGPLSRFFIALAVLALAGVVFAATHKPDEVAVLIAVRDIPAYQVISAGDITLGTRTAGRKQNYAVLPVEGRLTLSAVTKDEPLRQDQVAPDIASVLPGVLTVHGFAVSRASVLNGALRTGDPIQLLLVRDGKKLVLFGKNGVTLDRLDAVVLTVAGDGDTPTLVVAMRDEDVKANELAIGTGTVVVFKNPAASYAPK